MMFKHTKFLSIITLLFFIIDRISKLWALSLGSSIISIFSAKNVALGFSWIPDINFKLVFNRGMSWGILNSQANYIFIAVSILVCVITLWLLRYIIFKYRSGLSIFPEILIFFGSVSNIFDRFVYGGVIDFIAVNFDSWTFPVFNLADCAIVIGIFLMFINLMLDTPIKSDANA